jgi:hypothetical protein
MKRGIIVLLSLIFISVAGYFVASRWAIQHTTLTFQDLLRSDRVVSVDVAVRRDRNWQATAEMLTLPVAIINHGNTVKNTEYSFLANLLAARGYMVASIQHDLETDEPMVTKVGEEYVGRRPQYNRGNANIMSTLDQLKTIQPNADYRHLTMIGHSNGGDISMYFAKLHPDMIKKVITLDNLRVPFATDGKFKILSFRSRDPVFKTDPGVVPDDDICAKAGITVIRTNYQHTDMSDRGPDEVKSTIGNMVDKFLDENDRDEDDDLAPLRTTVKPDATSEATKPQPGSLALSATSAKN